MSKSLDPYLTTGSSERPGVKWVPNERVVFWRDCGSGNAYFQVGARVHPASG
jgi:hypothetical protein